jgi:hypothetical protein
MARRPWERDPNRRIAPDCSHDLYCYRERKCGSEDCRRANAREQKRQKWLKARGYNAQSDARPSIRLLQGIRAQGWPPTWIAEQLGLNLEKRTGPQWMYDFDHERKYLRAATVARIEQLAEQVGDRQAPYEGMPKHWKTAVTKTRKRAAEEGWLPLIWGTYDELAELRQLKRHATGERHRRKIEREDETLRLYEIGEHSLASLARSLGSTDRQVSRDLKAARERRAPEADQDAPGRTA